MFKSSKSEVEGSESHDDVHGLEFHPHYTEIEHGREYHKRDGSTSEIPRTMAHTSPLSLERSISLLTLSDIEDEYGISGYTWVPVSPTDQVEVAHSKILKSPAQVKTSGVTKSSTSFQRPVTSPFSPSDGRPLGPPICCASSNNSPVYHSHDTDGEPNPDRNTTLSNPSSNTKEAIDNLESELPNIRKTSKLLHAIHAMILPFRNHQEIEASRHESTSPTCEEREGNTGGGGKVCDIDKSHSFKLAAEETQMRNAESSVGAELCRSESRASLVELPRQGADTVVGVGSWILETQQALSELDPELIFEVSSETKRDAEKKFQFNQGWQSCPQNCAGQSGGTRSSSDNKTSLNQSSSGSTGSGSLQPKGDERNQKRSYKCQRNPNDGDGDDDQDQDQSKKPKVERSLKRRFACPFWKKNPQFYQTSAENGKKYMACAAGMGFTDIARLKEHLNRVHLLPITCSRCGLNFEEKEELDNHTRDIERNGCKVLPQKLQEGITPDIQAKLKRRSKDGKHPSDEEKWLDIYHLLFPHSPDPVSGPYRECLNSASLALDRNESFLDFADRELPRILERRFEAGLLGFCPNPESRAQLKQFIFSEFHFGMEQLSAPFREIELPTEDFNQLRQIPSVGSYADSGYASLPRCGNIDCDGGCMLCTSPTPSPMSARKCGNGHCVGCIVCVDMATPSSDILSSSLRPNALFSDDCIDPSMLSNSF